MQRTVYSTKFTFVRNELNEDGTIASRIDTVTVHETDEKKALKKAFKSVGTFAPLKVEKISALYILDDDIFFKYATIKAEGENNDEADA